MNLLGYLALICAVCVAVPLIVGYVLDDGYEPEADLDTPEYSTDEAAESYVLANPTKAAHVVEKGQIVCTYFGQEYR